MTPNQRKMRKSLINMKKLIDMLIKKNACTGIGIEYGHRMLELSPEDRKWAYTGKDTIRITYDSGILFPKDMDKRVKF